MLVQFVMYIQLSQVRKIVVKPLTLSVKTQAKVRGPQIFQNVLQPPQNPRHPKKLHTEDKHMLNDTIQNLVAKRLGVRDLCIPNLSYSWL